MKIFYSINHQTYNASNIYYRGVSQLNKWEDVPQILKQDNRFIRATEGKGFCLIESVQCALAEDYDIFMSCENIIDHIANQLVDDPEYLKYSKRPLTQADVNAAIKFGTSTRIYGRLVSDMYMPALATALQLHIRVITNVHGYYTIMHNTPLKTYENAHWKVINLLDDEGKYQPIVYVKPEDQPSTSTDTTDTDTSPENPKASTKGETQPADEPEVPTTVQTPTTSPGKVTQDLNALSIDLDTNVTVIPETQISQIAIIPETQLSQIPNAQCTSNDNVNNTIDETNIEDVVIVDDHSDAHADGTAIQIEESLSPASSTENSPTQEFSIGPGRYFSMQPFARMVPEVVESIPANINGKRFYMIDLQEGESYTKKYKDGRYFAMHTSKRKGFRGVRKVGTCKGNFECGNSACSFYIESGKRNSHQFTTIGANKFCFTCNSMATRRKCSAIKCIEYNKAAHILEVFHLGEHTCEAKQVAQEDDDKFLEDSIRKFGTTLGPKELAKMKMSQELRTQMSSGQYDMTRIADIASKFTDSKKISNMKKKIDQELRSERHSLAAVYELKQVTDTSDPYLIYKVNDASFNDEQDIVFKTSRRMLNLALSMDQNATTKSPLQEEIAYFDGMHSRCKNWKTLTLWVYHPVSRKLMHLATMETKSESSTTCALFWKIWNKALAEVKGEANYSFNPKGFMTDEAGANANGILEVYGPDAIRKSYTCQFHFKQCLNRRLKTFPSNLNHIKTEFEALCMQLLTCTTLTEYTEIKTKLEQLSGLVPSLEGWLQWWFARRYNLFPIFRGYCLSSVNLAEIGHSTLKRKKQLMLVDAAWEDVATMMLQEQEHTAFLQGIHKTMGRGPSIPQLAAREKKDQRKRSRDYQEEFRQKHFNLSDGVQEGQFIPSKRARHRAPENVLVQGHNLNPPLSTSISDPGMCEVPLDQRRTQCVTTCPTGTSTQVTQVLSQNITTPLHLPPSFQPASASFQFSSSQPSNPKPPITTPLHASNITIVPLTNSQRLNLAQRGLTPDQQKQINTNPPLLCFFHGNIAICQGCSNKFTPNMKYPPNDLLVKMLVVKPRLINGKWEPGWKKSWGYFHLNINCIQKNLGFVEVEDIYVPNAVKTQLKIGHIDKLKN